MDGQKRCRWQRLQVGSFSGQGGREQQQDSFGLCTPSPEKGMLAVVADGMGGLQNGGELARMTVDVLLHHFQSTPVPTDERLELCDLCAVARRTVETYLGPYGRGKGGTTLVMALLRRGKVSFLSVGDSRIALVRSGGLVWLNRPHDYAAQLSQLAVQGEIPLDQVLRDPQRMALTSYLGSDRPLLVDVSPEPVTLVRGDRLLLLSDGVFGVLSQQEMTACIKGTAGKTAERLEKKILVKKENDQDNFTGIVLRYGYRFWGG